MSAQSTAPLAVTLGLAAAFLLAPSAAATTIDNTLECDGSSVTSLCMRTGLPASSTTQADGWDGPMSNPAYWAGTGPGAPVWVFD